MDTHNTIEYDVVIVGAGLAGLAGCIFLAKEGLRVVCIDPKPFPQSRVGESLDWSAPKLLNSLGFSPDQLIEEQIATRKRKLKVVVGNGEQFLALPPPWLNEKPAKGRPETLHVDRYALDQRLFETAESLGVTFMADRASTIETVDDRVIACHTSMGQRVTASWFIDASGGARLFAKSFGVSRVEYGRSKVCLWTHFDTGSDKQGTTLYNAGNSDDEYLSWTWEIPITPHKTSVGYITSADQIKKRRRIGHSLEQILTSELAKFPRLSGFVAEQNTLQVEARSYRTYVSKRACGSNWFMVGEAASMPDPLTAHGVTAAIRHAREATGFIIRSLEETSISKRDRKIYDANVCRLGHAFNQNIEAAGYDWPIRWGLGFWKVIRVYALFGVLTNFLYSKYPPQNRFRLALFWFWLKVMRLWVVGWVAYGKLAYWTNQTQAEYSTPESVYGER